MNHKEYLLGLLDGSHTLSHEGIGLVLEQLAALQAVAEAAESYLGMWVEKDDPRDRDLRDALAALDG